MKHKNIYRDPDTGQFRSRKWARQNPKARIVYDYVKKKRRKGKK